MPSLKTRIWVPCAFSLGAADKFRNNRYSTANRHLSKYEHKQDPVPLRFVMFVCFFKFGFLTLPLSLFLLGFFFLFLLLAFYLNYARFCDTRIKPCEQRLLSADTWRLAFTKSFVSLTSAQLACLHPWPCRKETSARGVYTLILAFFSCRFVLPLCESNEYLSH